MTDDGVPPGTYLERARESPGDAEVGDIVPYFDANEGMVRKATADALYEVAKDEPARLVEADAVPALVAALEDTNPLVREGVAMALADVAEESDALTPFADTLLAHLNDEYDIITDSLAYALRHIAATTPEAVMDAVPELLRFLDAELASTRFHVITTLVGVAVERPDKLFPAVEPLLGVADSRDPQATRSNERNHPKSVDTSRTDALTATDIEPEPERGPGPSDHAATDLEPWIVEAALTVLATMSAEQPGDMAARLRSHIPRLRGLLDDPHAGIRAVTAGTLAAVAEFEPGAVEPVTDQLADRLSDDATTAAGNAAWALRYINTPHARNALHEADPEHDDVQTVIDTALDELDE
jgi:HEAT repeat protein